MSEFDFLSTTSRCRQVLEATHATRSGMMEGLLRAGERDQRSSRKPRTP